MGHALAQAEHAASAVKEVSCVVKGDAATATSVTTDFAEARLTARQTKLVSPHIDAAAAAVRFCTAATYPDDNNVVQ